MTDPALILPDTSIWIDHLRIPNLTLVRELRDDRVLSHPYVIGELALGSLKDRALVIAQLGSLPEASVAQHREVMEMIEAHTLAGAGIGYVDAHLLASTMLMPGVSLWTRDKRLLSIAERLGVAATPVN